MGKLLSKFAFSLGALVMLGLGVSSAKAEVIGLCTDVPGQSGLGACQKSVTINSANNTVVISITNLNTTATGGFITADAFNFAAGTVVTGFTSSNTNFTLTNGTATFGQGGATSLTFGAGTIVTQPTNALGAPRNALVSIGGDFEGEGSNPNQGIGAGQTVTFTFTMSAASLALNSEMAILTSEALRFRGFANGDSDKALVAPTTPTAPIPEPATMILLGTGLAGVAAKVRKRRKGQDQAA